MIDALDEKTISSSIDLTDLKLGAHNVLITFELDEDTVSYADTYAAVTIEVHLIHLLLLIIQMRN